MTTPNSLVIETFPASRGDAFLIRALAPGGTTNVLIDAGFAGTYRQHIKPRLETLAKEGAELRALIVTHIDADHIEGAIEFIADNGDSSNPRVIPIRDVWHNSYRHLSLEGRAPTPEEVAKVLAQARRARPSETADISARQGSTLAARLLKHGYQWNSALVGAPIAVDAALKAIDLGNGLRITVLSPTSQQLQRLGRLWRKELLAMGLPPNLLSTSAFESAFEEIALDESELEESEGDDIQIASTTLVRAPEESSFQEDRSATNASSIALLVQYGSASALLLGDALPSVIETQLRRLWGGKQQAVDLIKISHHGSKKSTSPQLLRLLRARNALLSTDGSKHGHPDLEALLWIVASQPEITLHFNYPTSASERMDQADIMSIYRYTTQTAAANTSFSIALASQ